MNLYILISVAACIVCFIAGHLSGRDDIRKVDGILGIDKRDKEKDYYDFVILTPTEELEHKTYLKVEVKVKN